jgi:Ca2+-binding EF-hand superfamily protein
MIRFITIPIFLAALVGCGETHPYRSSSMPEFDLLDRNRDNGVDLDEWIISAKDARDGLPPSPARERYYLDLINLFRHFDRNSDGVISAMEWRSLRGDPRLRVNEERK